MKDPIDRIETPCIKVCQLDGAGRTCLGCGRTRAEIAGWPTFSTAERRRIMAELPARRGRLRTGQPSGNQE